MTEQIEEVFQDDTPHMLALEELEAVKPSCGDCGPGTIVWPCNGMFHCLACSGPLGVSPMSLETALSYDAPPAQTKKRRGSYGSAASRVAWASANDLDMYNEDGCPYCGKSAIVVVRPHQGDVVCTSCGLEIACRMMDRRPEWRNFTDNVECGGVDKSRVGAPVTNPTSSKPENTRIGVVACGGGADRSRTLWRHHQKMSGQNASVAMKEADDMEKILVSALGYGRDMIDLARKIYVDFNDVHKTPRDARLTVQAACGCIASGVHGVSQERRHVDEVAMAFGVDVDATKKCCAQLRSKLAGREYHDVLMHTSEAMDAIEKRIRMLPPDIVPDELIRPVINMTLWINNVIGPEAAGSYEPMKFAQAMIAVASMEITDNAINRKQFVAEFKIGVQTLTKHETTIRRAIKRKAGVDAICNKAAEFKERYARIIANSRLRLR